MDILNEQPRTPSGGFVIHYSCSTYIQVCPAHSLFDEMPQKYSSLCGFSWTFVRIIRQISSLASNQVIVVLGARQSPYVFIHFWTSFFQSFEKFVVICKASGKLTSKYYPKVC